MTHQPPPPAAATPPYPLHPEPHEDGAPAYFADGATHDEDDDAPQYRPTERFSLPDILSSHTIALSAAIGLGVAAIAGALLYGAKAQRATPRSGKTRAPARRHTR